MMRLRRRAVHRTVVATALAGVAGWGSAGGWTRRVTFAAGARDEPVEPNAVLRWNGALLETIRRTRVSPPVASRAMGMLHTAIYDAWAAYDAVAVGTRLGGDLRRPAGERTPDNKQEAISFAAYRTLVDLFPAQEPLYRGVISALGYDPAAALHALGRGTQTPSGVGTIAALAVLDFRHTDGANQLGDRAPGAYADYSGYSPMNTADNVADPNHWQPLRVADSTGALVVQKCVTPQWGLVTPFGLQNGWQLRPESGPPLYGSTEYRDRADELLVYSATLTDVQKVIAEYWEDGPGTSLPPGHWHEIAQGVSQRDGHSLDDDVALFFALGNAMMDAAITVWDCKRAMDYVRPITAIRTLYKGKQVRAWAGYYRGSGLIDGGDWQPYQRSTVVTPAFQEFVSGHSTFSAAGAEILRRFTGSDAYGGSHTRPAQTSLIEPAVTPTTDVILSWDTFSAASDEAGMSRRYGGIHFQDGDLGGRAMGRQVATMAWERAQAYLSGGG